MICLSNSDISAFVSLFFFLLQTVMVMGDSREGVACSSWFRLGVLARELWNEISEQDT